MEIYNLVLSFVVLILGLLLVRKISLFIDKAIKSKQVKGVIGSSEILKWYLSYFIKLGLYITVCLLSISLLGFAREILQLLALIMALSIIFVLAFSLKDVIPSLIAGAYLLNSNFIKKGDKIKIKNIKGKVKEINLFSIIVEEEDGGIVMIPNKLIMEKMLKKNKKQG